MDLQIPNLRVGRVKSHRHKPEGADGLTVSEAERTLGLSQGSLHNWLKRHGLKHHMQKRGKYRVMSWSLLERFEFETARGAIERRAQRPKGWVGIEKASDVLRASKSLIWKYARRGEIRAVRVGYTNYYDPASLERFRLTELARPLPGWAKVNSYADRLKADRTAVAQWLRRRGYEVRGFRCAQGEQPENYAHENHLRLWEQHRKNAVTLGKLSGRKLSDAQVIEVKKRIALGESITVIAKDAGVTPAAIRAIRAGKTYKDVGL
jgi:hypothetical protein